MSLSNLTLAISSLIYSCDN